jgi:hypothetical protein
MSLEENAYIFNFEENSPYSSHLALEDFKGFLYEIFPLSYMLDYFLCADLLAAQHLVVGWGPSKLY